MNRRRDEQRSILVRALARVRDALAWRVDGLRRRLARRVPHNTVLYARTRALWSRAPLPPGDFLSVIADDRQDRMHLRRRSDMLGPVFSSLALGQYCICVNDLAIARRLLMECGHNLHVLTVDIASLVPAGFMRQMIGDVHRQYRKSLARAVLSHDPVHNLCALEKIAAGALHEYAHHATAHGNTPDALRDALRTMATDMLMQLVLGVPSGSTHATQLREWFAQLGPRGFVWRIGTAQRHAFTSIASELRAWLVASEQCGHVSPDAILQRMRNAGTLDDTMLGNLIYMVEMGRHDMASFFRWILRHAGAHPEALAAIATDRAATHARVTSDAFEADKPHAHAFVLETLRRNQSERLMRRATCDMTFDGMLIPRGAMIRIGLWEAHHDTTTFDTPAEFAPSRFLDHPPTAEAFSPFGLDQHLCPFASYVVRLGVIFAEAIAVAWVPTLIADGPPVVGMNHWEPPAAFSVALEPRTVG